MRKGSQGASKREAMTSHLFEYLNDGIKATFCIENYLGGTYHLTPDEIVCVDGKYIIQESKNSTKKALPDLSDIQDGLFKLILYSNLDSLELNQQQVSFSTRLKLTGKDIRESITLSSGLEDLERFLEINHDIFNAREQSLIKKLYIETQVNDNIEIEIKGNN